MSSRNAIHVPQKIPISTVQEVRCEIDQKILMSPPLHHIWSVCSYGLVLIKISQAQKLILLSLDSGLEEMPRGSDESLFENMNISSCTFICHIFLSRGTFQPHGNSENGD